MQRLRSRASVSATAVGRRNATITGPNQIVRPPAPVQDGGMKSGSPARSAAAPTPYPARTTRVCGERSERISHLLVTGSGRLRDAPRGAAARTRPFDQVLNEVLADGRVALRSNLLGLSLGRHEPRVAEHGEMPGNRRPARLEAVRDLSGRQRPVPQEPEDLAPGLVGERAECLIRPPHGVPRPCIISKLANCSGAVKGGALTGLRRGGGEVPGGYGCRSRGEGIGQSISDH